MVKVVDKAVNIFFLKKIFDILNKIFNLTFMYHKNTPATIQKALYWLYQQEEWSQHITDSNTAVKMYLKAHKKEEELSLFQKNLGTVCENLGVSIKSLPEKSLAEKSLAEKSLAEKSLPEKKTFSKKTQLKKEERDVSMEFETKESYIVSQKKSDSIKKPLSLTKESYSLSKKSDSVVMEKVQKQESYCESPFAVQIKKPIAPCTTKSSGQIKSSGQKGVETHLALHTTRQHSLVFNNKRELQKDMLVRKQDSSVSLDTQSLQTLADVKKEWNLKSDAEALSLLIEAGRKNLQRLL